nr:hypothetical protein [Sphingobium sp. Sx8-8]
MGSFVEYYAQSFDTISELILRHSPSGFEHDVDELIARRFRELGVPFTIDAAGNLIGHIKGSGPGSIAITAHKDEIGATVTHVEDNGRLKIQNLGGSFPWVYGEGIVDILGDHQTISGVLCFGSRHVSHASPQFEFKDVAPLRWKDVWIETKLSREQLDHAGVRPGARMVVGKHRKQPYRLNDHIAGYTLDNKASLAILIELAARIHSPIPDVFLVATAKEEVGGIGVLHFVRHHSVDALVALEIAPIAPEYPILTGADPVLVVEDSYGIYDDPLNRELRKSAAAVGVSLQLAVLNGFGSDGSIAMKSGGVARAACLGFPTENTHGFEIAHLGALRNMTNILVALCDGNGISKLAVENVGQEGTKHG